MEVEYKAYKGRRTERIKIVIFFFVFWVLYSIVAGLFYYSNLPLVGDILIALAYLGFIPSIIFFSRYWVSEPRETMIFVNLYKALGFLQLYSEKKEVSKIYLGKAAKHVKKAITRLNRLCASEEINSILFDNEFCEPLETLSENLKNRILPRIVQGKKIHEMQSMLKGLATVFGEIVRSISLNEIVSLNKILENFEEVSIREKAIKSAFKAVMMSKPMALLSSIFLGYFSVIAIIFLFCQILQMDLISFMRDNLAVVISGGAVISGMYTAVLVFKR